MNRVVVLQRTREKYNTTYASYEAPPSRPVAGEQGRGAVGAYRKRERPLLLYSLIYTSTISTLVQAVRRSAPAASSTPSAVSREELYRSIGTTVVPHNRPRPPAQERSTTTTVVVGAREEKAACLGFYPAADADLRDIYPFPVS